MPPPPPNLVWDEPSLRTVCAHAAALARRLTGGFAGVSWATDRAGVAGEWLVTAGEAPQWVEAGADSVHPWDRYEPLVRIPVPGAAGLTLAARAGADHEALMEVAALLSAGSLTTSAPRLRQVLESSPDGVFLVDRDWRFTHVNQRGATLLEQSPSSLMGQPLWDCFPEAVGTRFQEVYQRVFETGQSESLVEYFAPLQTWFQVEAFVSGDELCVFFRDVTEQKREQERLERLEEDLRAALERLRRIADVSRDMICTWTPDGRYQTVNEAARRILGYDPEQMSGVHILDLVPEEDRWMTLSAMGEVMGGQPQKAFRNRLRHRDGRLVELEWSSAWSDPDGVGLAVARDITEHQEAEKRLLESEHRYRLLFDENPQQMWMYDDETYQMLAVNRAALENYGYTREEFLQLTVFDLVHPDELELARTRLITNRKPGPRSGLWKHRRKDGSAMLVQGWSHPLPLEGRPARFSVAMDVTRQQALEEQLRQAQKMEAIGELAGGVAHDFNNLLTVINGYASLGRGAAAGTPAAPMFQMIEQAGGRAARLTQQLLAFSRRQVLRPEVMNLNDAVTSIEPMLRQALPENVELQMVLAPSLRLIRADADQLEQVLLNLVLNARDAIQRRPGRVSIETFNVVLDDHYRRAHPEAVPGQYVLLTVTDTGHGMDAATVARAFEPFFTTKVRGRGTGLGLPMVYGIVKQSGGHMGVYSEVGTGTTMKVYLPAAPLDELPDQLGDSLAEEAPAPRRGHEVILLAEDDERVREFTRIVLEERGYRVLEASDGHEALTVAGEAEQVDLLLTDVVLPRVGGRELAQRMAPLRPGMRVLFVSGYTENAIVHHGALDPGLDFLPKPYSPDALARKVRAVLDQPMRLRSVLIVARNGGLAEEIEGALTEAGYQTILAATSAETLKRTRGRAVDLVLTSLRLPGYSDAEALAFFREEFPHARVALLAEPHPALQPDVFIPVTAPVESLLASVRALIG